MRSRPRQRGVALLLVLWVFMLLGVLALDFAQYIRDDAMATVNFADETRGYYVALAGLNLALYERSLAAAAGPGAGGPAGTQQQQQPSAPLDEEPEPLIPWDGQWHEGDFGPARWSVRVVDEAARIPLNALRSRGDQDAPFLHYVIENLVRRGNRTTGLDRRMQKRVDTVTDSILDWLDRDHEARLNGAENDFYRKQRIPYSAKDGQLESLEELLRVRGVTPELFYGSEGMPGLRDVFSVRPAREDEGEEGRAVNVRNATPAVLQTLVGDADTLTNLFEQRDQGLPLLPLVQALVVTNSGGRVDPERYLKEYDNPLIATIEARADMSTERNQARIAALVDVRNEILILRWYDRAPWEGPPPSLPAGEDDL